MYLKYINLRPFWITKWQISLSFHIHVPYLVKLILVYRLEAWKRYPFQMKPPGIVFIGSTPTLLTFKLSWMCTFNSSSFSCSFLFFSAHWNLIKGHYFQPDNIRKIKIAVQHLHRTKQTKTYKKYVACCIFNFKGMNFAWNKVGNSFCHQV